MEKITMSNKMKDVVGVIDNGLSGENVEVKLPLSRRYGLFVDLKASMLAHADKPNMNGRVYTREAINHAFANYEVTHRINHKSLRLERNWTEAKKEEPRYFSSNKLRKLNYRQAKKRLTLAAYWE